MKKLSKYEKETIILFNEGEDTAHSAALSQKAALQMPFSFTTPPVKK